MGQAKQRGSYEERQAEGIAKREAREKAMAEVRAARIEIFKDVRPEQSRVTLNIDSRGRNIAQAVLIQALLLMSGGDK